MNNKKIIYLPEPAVQGKISLEEAIFKRRSERDFKSKELTPEQISQLLWAGGGKTCGKFGCQLRASPSAGALYPLEIFLLTKDGMFRYLPEKHGLEIWQESDLREKLAQACLGQVSVAQAPADFLLAADFSRITSKYGERGLRYTYIEIGHVAQNIHLQAVALGLGSVPIGAFFDDQVKALLLLPEDDTPLYVIPVGAV